MGLLVLVGRQRVDRMLNPSAGPIVKPIGAIFVLVRDFEIGHDRIGPRMIGALFEAFPPQPAYVSPALGSLGILWSIANAEQVLL